MFQQLFRNMPDVVKNLLIINVLMYLARLAISPDGADLNFTLGMYYFDSEHFEPYQTVSHFFMHGNFIHIFFNMFALVLFGSRLEMVWGPKRFLFFFLATAVGAAIMHSAVNAIQLYNVFGTITPFSDGLAVIEGNQIGINGVDLTAAQMQMAGAIHQVPVVGASGAVFGILIAFAMYFPNTKLMLLFPPIPIAAKYFVGIYVAIELYLGWQNSAGDNIAHFAHLGGALVGFIIVLIWKKGRSNFF